jgi:hypothetical protein
MFCAIVVLTQLAIINGEKLFSTGYLDPPYYTNTAYDVDSDDEDETTTNSYQILNNSASKLVNTSFHYNFLNLNH